MLDLLAKPWRGHLIKGACILLIALPLTSCKLTEKLTTKNEVPNGNVSQPINGPQLDKNGFAAKEQPKQPVVQTLFDFRDYDFQDDSSPSISSAEKGRILSAVFRSYLTKTDDCKEIDDSEGNGDDLAAARKAGQIVPDVVSSATGSFTGAGLKQTAYIITVGECNAGHIENNYGTKRLAIFSENKLVANVDPGDVSTILQTYDLNGDGVMEMLLAGGFTSTGELEGWATLVDFHQGKLRVIKRFPNVREDSCESDLKGRHLTASVIHYTPKDGGEMPEFAVDQYGAACPPEGSKPRWSSLHRTKH